MRKKSAVILMVALFIILAVSIAHIRIIKIADRPVVLLVNPFNHSGSSVGNDIKDSFDKAGKLSENILAIEYIGTNSDGDYFECTYKESDGSARDYYAFDDGDLNSTVRATVIWENP